MRVHFPNHFGIVLKHLNKGLWRLILVIAIKQVHYVIVELLVFVSALIQVLGVLSVIGILHFLVPVFLNVHVHFLLVFI